MNKLLCGVVLNECAMLYQKPEVGKFIQRDENWDLIVDTDFGFVVTLNVTDSKIIRNAYRSATNSVGQGILVPLSQSEIGFKSPEWYCSKEKFHRAQKEIIRGMAA